MHNRFVYWIVPGIERFNGDSVRPYILLNDYEIAYQIIDPIFGDNCKYLE